MKRLLGSYPSLNLHDPETYIADLVSLLTGYPLWVGEQAISRVKAKTDYPPGPKMMRTELEDGVRAHRYAAEWDAGLRANIAERKRIEGPRAHKPTYDELKAKYGPNWGINNPDKKQPPTREQCRAGLIAKIGQEAFDAIPEAPADEWKSVGSAVGTRAEQLREVGRREAEAQK